MLPMQLSASEAFATISFTARNGEAVGKQNQPEDSSMSRRLFVAILGVALAFLLMPQGSLAEEDHIAEAITHTKQAIDHGKQGHADVLKTHADAALIHAEAVKRPRLIPTPKKPSHI
jgi:hypothetical protein